MLSNIQKLAQKHNNPFMALDQMRQAWSTLPGVQAQKAMEYFETRSLPRFRDLLEKNLALVISEEEAGRMLNGLTSEDKELLGEVLSLNALEVAFVAFDETWKTLRFIEEGPPSQAELEFLNRYAVDLGFNVAEVAHVPFPSDSGPASAVFSNIMTTTYIQGMNDLLLDAIRHASVNAAARGVPTAYVNHLVRKAAADTIILFSEMGLTNIGKHLGMPEELIDSTVAELRRDAE